MPHRRGENHPRVTITDRLVNTLRDLHEHQGVGWRRLGAQFELPLTTVRKIIYYQRRLNTPRPPEDEGKRFM